MIGGYGEESRRAVGMGDAEETPLSNVGGARYEERPLSGNSGFETTTMRRGEAKEFSKRVLAARRGSLR